MSKLEKPFLYFWILFAALFTCLSVRAQALDVRVKVEAGTVYVSGTSSPEIKAGNIYFTREYAGHSIPGERILGLSLANGAGAAVGHRVLMPGEYLSNGDFKSFSYSIKPGIPANSATAHISWLGPDSGMLMFEDLLPRFAAGSGPAAATVTLDLPEGWKAGGVSGKAFETSDVSKTVLFIGKDLRELRGDNAPALVISGKWLFTDARAAEMAADIYQKYTKLFGQAPRGRTSIVFSEFPNTARPGAWEAETRGSTVVILSDDMPMEERSLQKLHEQLRHEIFHLWLPNNVNLSGSYDWFYEGFALYQALKTGVDVNRIRFDDMLDTLSRAYDIDKFDPNRLSLIEASNKRWAGGNTQVYARGMLVAFLCDILMLRHSKGKASVSDIFRQLQENHNLSKPRTDGNAAILKIMEAYPYLQPVIARYINGAETIDWRAGIDAAGLISEETGSNIRLKVKEEPDGRQKEILDKLGYNNWRKLTRNKK